MNGIAIRRYCWRLFLRLPAVDDGHSWYCRWPIFLNMEKVLQFMALPNYGTLIFNPRFISGIYLAAIILLYINLYRKHGNQPV